MFWGVSSPFGSGNLAFAKRKSTPKLLLLMKIKRLEALLDVVRRLEKRGHLPNLDVSQLNTIMAFLKGRGGKMMGVQWKKGLLASVALRASTHKPSGWMGRVGWLWDFKRLEDELKRVEVGLQISVKNSFLLRFALNQLFRLAGLSFYKEKFNGYHNYWLKLSSSVGLVLILKNDKILLRLLWKAGPFNTSSARKKIWQKMLYHYTAYLSSGKAYQALRAAEKAAASGSHWLLYLNVINWMDWLGSTPGVWVWKKGELQGIKSCGLSGLKHNNAFRIKEVCWFTSKHQKKLSPSITTLSQTSQTKPSPLTWIPTNHQLAMGLWMPFLVGKQPLTTWFRGFRSGDAFLKAAQKNWERSFGLSGTSWFWKERIFALFMAAQLKKLFKREVVIWQQERKTLRLKANHRVMMGHWDSSLASWLKSFLSNVPGVQKFGGHGSIPVFLWQSKGTTSQYLFTWYGKFWLLGNHPTSFYQALKKLKRGKNGSFLEVVDARNLFSQRLYSHDWNVLAVSPSFFAGCFAKRMGRHPWLDIRRITRYLGYIRSLEMATKLHSDKREVWYRLLYRRTRYTPPVTSPCPDVFWASVKRTLVLPFAQSVLWRVLYAVQNKR